MDFLYERFADASNVTIPMRQSRVRALRLLKRGQDVLFVTAPGGYKIVLCEIPQENRRLAGRPHPGYRHVH
jgi:hypothetical protein